MQHYSCIQTQIQFRLCLPKDITSKAQFVLTCLLFRMRRRHLYILSTILTHFLSCFQYKMTPLLKLTWFLSVVYLILPVSLNASDPPRRQDKKAKAVTTLLNAKWPVTPIVLEIAEYMAEENSDYFWDFIKGVNGLSTPLCDLGNVL